MGPSASAGKNVRPPTTRMTPTTRPTNRPPVVGNVPADAGDALLFRQRAGDRHGRDDHEEAADKHRDGAGDVVEHRIAGEPREGRAVIAGLRAVGVKHLAEAVRSGVGHGSHRGRIDHRDRRPAKDHQRQDQDGEHGHLDFLGLDLLADIFGRAADHQAGDEDRQDDEQQHAVQAGADAADDDLAELNVDERDHAAERGEASRAWH